MDRVFSLDGFHLILLLIGACLLLVAAILLLAWLGTSLRTNHFRAHGVATMATVVGYKDDEGSDLQDFFPLLEFLDATRGVVVRAYDERKSYGSHRMPKDYSLGRVVPILYLPHQPQKILINTPRNTENYQYPMLGLALGFALIGGLMAGAALLNLL